MPKNAERMNIIAINAISQCLAKCQFLFNMERVFSAIDRKRREKVVRLISSRELPVISVVFTRDDGRLRSIQMTENNRFLSQYESEHVMQKASYRKSTEFADFLKLRYKDS